MRFKQDFPTFNASIYLRTNLWSINKKNIREFMFHAANLVCIAIDEGNFDVSIMHHYLHHSLNVRANRFIILLLQTVKEIRVFLKKCMFNLQINLDRHCPRHSADDGQLPGPHLSRYPLPLKYRLRPLKNQCCGSGSTGSTCFWASWIFLSPSKKK
jgi:hypothetical protein